MLPYKELSSAQTLSVTPISKPTQYSKKCSQSTETQKFKRKSYSAFVEYDFFLILYYFVKLACKAWVLYTGSIALETRSAGLTLG